MQRDPISQAANALDVLRETGRHDVRARLDEVVTVLGGFRGATALDHELRQLASNIHHAVRTVCGDTIPSIIPPNHPILENLKISVLEHVDGLPTQQVKQMDQELYRQRASAYLDACQLVPSICSDYAVANTLMGEPAAQTGQWIITLADEIASLRAELVELRGQRVASSPMRERTAALVHPVAAWENKDRMPWD